MITSPPRVNRCSLPNHGVGPELDRVGKATLRRIVGKQIAAGVDIGNNGEQQREAFFLYVRHRMIGFGDSWPRGAVECGVRRGSDLRTLCGYDFPDRPVSH